MEVLERRLLQFEHSSGAATCTSSDEVDFRGDVGFRSEAETCRLLSHRFGTFEEQLLLYVGLSSIDIAAVGRVVKVISLRSV